MTRHIAIQLVEVVRVNPDQPTEIALQPEELGKVRMSLSTGDGVVQIALTAERPETLDLLRRNIDQLAQEFRGMGFRDVGFDFSGGGNNDKNDDQQPLNTGSALDGNPQQEPEKALEINLQSGVDIRI